MLAEKKIEVVMAEPLVSIIQLCVFAGLLSVKCGHANLRLQKGYSDIIMVLMSQMSVLSQIYNE